MMNKMHKHKAQIRAVCLVRQKLNMRVRYRIRALLHLAEAPFNQQNRVEDEVKYTQKHCKLPATQAAIIEPFLKLAHLALCKI